MSQSLNCLVFGDDPSRSFSIEISMTEKVHKLKLLIKEMNPAWRDVEVMSIDLWKVSINLDNLETELGDINLNDCPKLSPSVKKLSSWFDDASDDFLHVIVKVPPTYFSFNCLIFGDDRNGIFVIDTSVDCTVSKLQKLIQDWHSSSLGKLDARQIALWKVSFPLDDFSSKYPTTPGPMLRPEKKLSGLFPVGTESNVLHIVARIQGLGPSLSSRPPPSAYKFTIASTDQVAQSRQNFCQNRKPEAPSTGGVSRTFFDKQSKEDTRILCGRPYGHSAALPVTLLHPAFGKFVDDAKDYVPMPTDIALFHDFVEAMANIYKVEEGRRQELLRVFEKHGLYMKGSKIGPYTTDADLSYKGFRTGIAEFKNESGSGGAELYFQDILYYLEATRDLASRYPNSVLPCILILVFGPYIAFAGATWTDRPTIQMLSPAIPCHYHHNDINMEGILARHLGAFRRAITSLDEYYDRLYADSSKISRNPMLPYPTSFKSQNGLSKHFKYHSQMKGRNLYFANIDVDVDGDYDGAICVKFVTRYCKEAHEFLAEKGCAPPLHTVERLPGGLYMVVMKDLSQDYISLFNFIQDNRSLLSEENEITRSSLSEKIRQNISELHQAGFVHGDMRNTNIMVKKSGLDDGSFLLVDYDFSGEIKKVRYPLDLNIMTVKRPEGATGGGIIEVGHDLEMLDAIWEI